MDYIETEWIEELRRQVRDHVQFVPLDNRRTRLGPQYENVMDALTPEQRRVITDYLQVEKEIGVCLANMAYMSGIQVGQRRERRKEALYG